MGTFSPIAVVGRACVLPGALNPAELWDAVVSGKDLLSAAPEGLWRVPKDAVLCEPDSDSTDRAWTDRGGYVRGFEQIWDPAGFGLPATELNGLDPLFRYALHVGREALKDAGCWEGETRQTLAVLGNLGFPSAELARFAEGVWWGNAENSDPRNRFMSGLPALLLEQALYLGPGAFALDAACASGLYAIKLGCDALHDGRADRVLAGGVNRADDLFLHVGFAALNALSQTGQSRPFHAQADGLVPAEGCALVVLRRLKDAQDAGERILGVIRGIGLSNDGRGRGFLAPAAEGQVQAMRAAYANSGWEPKSVSLVECHATGTTVGDSTELRSLSRVFADAADVPIGSLKSNMGHLITAAGAAGLIKVLEAMGAGVRPPSLHTDMPLPSLARGPIRVLSQAEPWTVEGPRRAAVSAFGFGGNNAHLLVEEPNSAIREASATGVTPLKGPIAIVGLGVRAGSAANRAEFSAALFDEATVEPRASEVILDLKGMRFPPRDLQQALGQQLLVLAAVGEAVHDGAHLDPDRTGTLVGMGTDAEVARYGARWRAPVAAHVRGLDPSEVSNIRDAFVPVLEAPAVLGTMPNIPANRLNQAFGWTGPSYTVSAEEASGHVALALGIRALRAGELDAVVVAATDLSDEPVHLEALAAVRPGENGAGGDAAVALVLKRLDDAVVDGDPIYAVLDELAEPGHHLGDRGQDLRRVFGRAHASEGLLNVAAAALALQCQRPLRAAGWSSPAQVVQVESRPLAGSARMTRLTRPPAGCPKPRTTATPERPLVCAAHPPAVCLPIFPHGLPENVGPWQPPTDTLQIMEPPMALPTVHSPRPAPAAPVEGPVPVLPQAPPMPAAPPITPVLMAAQTGLGQILARQSALQAHMAQVHQAFLAQQSALHHQFLQVRQQATFTLLDAARAAGALPGAVPMPQPTLAVPIVAQWSSAAEPAKAPVIEPVGQPVIAPLIQAEPPISAEPTADPARPLPHGRTFSREQLLVHASGAISSLFGPQFAPQDRWDRQVRMPEPPLLLADRVVGLDAVPASMGKGTIWTETDVTWDAWYLHQGRMPAGVLIEAGQADLMLISYLGIDLHNQGERIYRLLGCTLTYHRELPRPGETLLYDIHVDGHAKHGDVRLFFFHYDSHIGDDRMLSVTNGQAGFFTNQELAESDGILWRPEDQEIVAEPRMDPPTVENIRSSFSADQVRAFAEARPWECFGPGLELTKCHVRTPRIGQGQLQFFDQVQELSVHGGPWKRGYLRASRTIRPDDWFFDGHFKGDPCMPGTLMFEGCLQAMSFFMTAFGFTVARDGWHFEPVTNEPFDLKCRGQTLPSSTELITEIFVEEIIAGPIPTIYADLLCTDGGLKGFHARRVGLRLVPDWPLSTLEDLQITPPDDRALATSDGFPFDYRSLIACAWGRPSEAFGPRYREFDGPRYVARLPGPPYHFLTRMLSVDKPLGCMETGTTVVSAYDVPGADEWYFQDGGHPTMPLCVIMEAALQPCGWLASYSGSSIGLDSDLYFRNLDGTATLHAEITPNSGTLINEVTITTIAKSAGMIIESFTVRGLLDGELVYDVKTVFGYFPPLALANQIGLPVSDEARAWHDAEPTSVIEVRDRPAALFSGNACLPSDKLLLIDRVLDYSPGCTQLRGQKDVDPSHWYFKAHFYGDPVQPGSLGIEAMVQTLQSWMLLEGLSKGLANPRFEPVAVGRETTWKYRGQVIPTNKLVTLTVAITDCEQGPTSATATADASLWVDGKRIYEMKGMSARIVAEGPAGDHTVVLDPAVDTWLGDHRPTFTVAALPLMSMVDALAAAAPKATGLRNLSVRKWVPVNGPRTFRTSLDGDRLRLFASTIDGEEEVAVATVAQDSPPRPEPWAALQGETIADPYGDGTLFHGPAFQLVRSLVRAPGGASMILDAGQHDVPVGRLHPALLDAATHGIPHDAMHTWTDRLDGTKVAFPAIVPVVDWWGPPATSGNVRCEVRFDGFHGSTDFPAFRIQWIQDDRVFIALRLVEACFPKGPLGQAAPIARAAFMRDKRFVPGVSLSRFDKKETRLNLADIRQTDWLPGTILGIYGTTDPTRIALQEHAAARVQLHPSILPDALPYTRVPTRVTQADDHILVTETGPVELDLSQVETFWAERFGVARWPVADLYYGLIRRFVRRMVVEDRAALQVAAERPMLLLANHQCMLESLWFSVLAGTLVGRPVVTLAKAEHRTSWLGGLINWSFSQPGVNDPELIRFFDRSDRAALPGILKGLGQEMASGTRSIMVHVEGTRAFDCRTPVQKMTGAWLDLAVAANVAVVPVRFTGGLPIETAGQRLDFPVAMGSQDVWIGKPLLPEELSALNYGDRKALALSRMNGLGPDQDSPLPSDLDFADRVEAHARKTGIEMAYAVLHQVLATVPDPCEDTLRVLAGDLDPSTAHGAWLCELAQWLGTR
jgi:3-oxoacyl-(acyl-carrier-protein) synthase/3-hydroxymyristoyl/3-hydroxydecanoyl-(acyl carrier protein) dehydratase/1-acyl-sn-glycerol-3-phosphate acyltransferase